MTQLQSGKLLPGKALLQHFAADCFSRLQANANTNPYVSGRQHCEKCNKSVAKPAYILSRGWRNCMVDIAEIVMN